MPKSRNKRKNRDKNVAKKQQEMNRKNNEIRRTRSEGVHDPVWYSDPSIWGH